MAVAALVRLTFQLRRDVSAFPATESGSSPVQAAEPKSISAKDRVGITTGVLALFISLASFWNSWRVTHDVAFIDAIKIQYGVHGDLSKLQLQNPLMSHLFAPTPERYDKAIAMIRRAVSSLAVGPRASRQLEEGATANQIFTAYEEVHILWTQAKLVQDQRRAALFEANLVYFSQLLCNPRLLWYWDIRNGMRLGLEFSDDVKAHHKEETKECSARPDPIGPFADTN